MDVIKGAGDPTANLHERARAQCDWCGAALKGPMPKPFWVTASSRQNDEHGHPTPEPAPLRVYLCSEHRETMTQALESAQLRERDRFIKGQRMFPDSPHLRPVE